MTTENNPVPSMDHGDIGGEQSEQALFDAVLQNSEFYKEAAGIEEPLPVDEALVPDTADTYEEDDQQEYEDVDTEEESEEQEEEAAAEDDESTQDVDVYTSDDLDLDAQVRVVVDGEEMDVSFADLLKGYQTDASISKKGRELGEARKELDAEKAKALEEVQELSKASAAVLMGKEQNLAAEYHEIEGKIKEARESGDTFELSELKDKREELQGSYWEARKEREGLQGKLKEQEEAQLVKQNQEELAHFNEVIEDYVPGFNADVAQDIRKFALDEGISEGLLDTITDPSIVKFLNDYRVLKHGVSKGQAKRKSAPAKKAVPTKKGKTVQQKAADKEQMVKARAFRDDATADDHMDFLRQYAANSLNNI